MIWILSSILLGIGVWLIRRLPIKYRVLEETDEFGFTRYYPERKLLIWGRYEKLYITGYEEVYFRTYTEAKRFILDQRLLSEKPKIITKRKLTV